MSEIKVAEKAGMLINDNKEIIGWVMVGEDYDYNEGDVLITHHKTAEKFGLSDEFKEMKAENQPQEESQEEPAVEKKTRIRCELTDDMTFEILRPDFVAASTEDARGETYRLLFELKNVGEFLKATKGYSFIGARDKVEKFCTARECIMYAWKRGAITKPAVV